MANDRRDTVAEIKDKLAKTQLKDRRIDTEVRDSFLDYAMSVLVSRALPDIRDGLKPVQRRIIFAADGLGMRAGTAYKKSARLVGEVIGKYHPHGDQSVYDAMVRMAQDFSLRHPLIDGHGNFGSVDGDGPAAMRYTESRLSRIATEMTRDIDKETVDFRDNYDGSETEPTVLPAYFPNMLVNGADGIAVGMATKIPPHNLQEIINALVALIENPAIDTAGLQEWIQGPDFPTGAQVVGSAGIANYFATGNGSVTIRSLYQINQFDNGKAQIIVTEIPYAVVKSSIVERIAELVADKQIEGIADLRDESSRKGIRIVIETKRDAVAEVVMNNLLKQTALQTTFSVNLVGLVNNRPKILVLKEMLQTYLDHHVQVIVRRSRFDSRKAKERAHVLEGLHLAVSNIDDVVELIRKADSQEQAQARLIERFKFSDIQAKAILEMRLGRLTGLERDKIESELKELVMTITDLEDIISRKERQLQTAKSELIAIRDKYADDRRTEILANASAVIDDESLIPVEEIVITMSSKGYLKRLPIDAYKTQRRGGVGVKGTVLNEDDDVGEIVVTTTHTDVLFFTNAGKVYRIRGHRLPVSSRQTKGMPAINFIPVEKGERIMSILPVDDYEDGYLFFTTLRGVVKRTPISEFVSIMTRGKIAIKLNEGDNLFSVLKTSGADEVFVGASNGRVCRFNENQVRPTGRNSAGVKGVSLPKNHEIVGASSTKEGGLLLSVGTNGLGKMSEASEYRLTRRGAKGVLAFKSNEKTGDLVATRLVSGTEDLIMITNEGQTIRLPLPSVRITGRVASGVRLMQLENKQKIQSIAVLAAGSEAVQEHAVDAAAMAEEQAAIAQAKIKGMVESERIEKDSPGQTDEDEGEDNDGQE